MRTQRELAEKAFQLKAQQISAPGQEFFDDRDILLTRREAAQYLRKSVPTLERWAKLGTGPKPVIIGNAARYRLRDLRSFTDAVA